MKIMKKILRKLIFSGVSFYLTSFIIKGLVINKEIKVIIVSSIILGVIYYLLIPLLKISFFPLNFITFGFFSLLAYFLIFGWAINYFNLAKITNWNFPGGEILGINLPPFHFNYWQTVILTSVVYSTIINLLEIFL